MFLLASFPVPFFGGSRGKREFENTHTHYNLTGLMLCAFCSWVGVFVRQREREGGGREIVGVRWRGGGAVRGDCCNEKLTWDVLPVDSAAVRKT